MYIWPHNNLNRKLQKTIANAAALYCCYTTAVIISAIINWLYLFDKIIVDIFTLKLPFCSK